MWFQPIYSTFLLDVTPFPDVFFGPKFKYIPQHNGKSFATHHSHGGSCHNIVHSNTSCPVSIVSLFISPHPIITTTWYVNYSWCFVLVITCFETNGFQQQCSVVRYRYASYLKPLPNTTNHCFTCTLKWVWGVPVDFNIVSYSCSDPPAVACVTKLNDISPQLVLVILNLRWFCTTKRHNITVLC